MQPRAKYRVLRSAQNDNMLNCICELRFWCEGSRRSMQPELMLKMKACEVIAQHGVEAARGFEIRQVADAVEDFEER